MRNTGKTSATRVVILGAGYAGMLAALRLSAGSRRLPTALQPEITLVNGSETFVERIRLHQVAANESVRQRPIRRLLRGTGVRFVQGWVTGIAPADRQVTVQGADGPLALGYDYLLYALGSTVDQESVPGVRDHALAPGNPAEAEELRRRLPALASANGEVLIVGGGLTGIESAAEIAATYPSLRVRLVTSTLGGGLSEAGRTHLRQTYARLGVRVEEGKRVARLDAGAAITAAGERIPFDLCVWAGSFRALPLARQAGLAVNGRDQILVDAYGQSISHPAIFAAGDGAAFAPDQGVPLRMACATALPFGAHAADNLRARLSGRADRMQPFGFAYVFQCISLGRRDGLIQFVRGDDSPRERILSGRHAAWFKEFICRFAAASATSALAARLYRWPGQAAGRKPTGERPQPSAVLKS